MLVKYIFTAVVIAITTKAATIDEGYLTVEKEIPEPADTNESYEQHDHNKSGQKEFTSTPEVQEVGKTESDHSLDISSTSNTHYDTNKLGQTSETKNLTRKLEKNNDHDTSNLISSNGHAKSEHNNDMEFIYKEEGTESRQELDNGFIEKQNDKVEQNASSKNSSNITASMHTDEGVSRNQSLKTDRDLSEHVTIYRDQLQRKIKQGEEEIEITDANTDKEIKGSKTKKFEKTIIKDTPSQYEEMNKKTDKKKTVDNKIITGKTIVHSTANSGDYITDNIEQNDIKETTQEQTQATGLISHKDDGTITVINERVTEKVIDNQLDHKDKLTIGKTPITDDNDDNNVDDNDGDKINIHTTHDGPHIVYEESGTDNIYREVHKDNDKVIRTISPTKIIIKDEQNESNTKYTLTTKPSTKQEENKTESGSGSGTGENSNTIKSENDTKEKIAAEVILKLSANQPKTTESQEIKPTPTPTTSQKITPETVKTDEKETTVEQPATNEKEKATSVVNKQSKKQEPTNVKPEPNIGSENKRKVQEKKQHELPKQTPEKIKAQNGSEHGEIKVEGKKDKTHDSSKQKVEKPKAKAVLEDNKLKPEDETKNESGSSKQTEKPKGNDNLQISIIQPDNKNQSKPETPMQTADTVTVKKIGREHNLKKEEKKE